MYKPAKQHYEIRLSGGRKNFGVVSNENKLFDTTANEKGEFESEKAGFQSGKHRLINKKAYPFGYA